jgi:O-antigen ligase
MMTTPPTTPGGGYRQRRIVDANERLAFNYASAVVPADAPYQEPVSAAAAMPLAAKPAVESSRWAYLGALAFTAVLLLRPQDQIPGLDALHLAQMCAAFAIAALLISRFARRLPLVRMTPEIVALGALGLVILATAPFSIWPGGVVSLFADSYLKIVVIFVLLISTLTTPKRLDQFTWLILMCCGYISFRACFDYARGINLVENGRVAGAVSGIFGNPNDLALNMVTFMPLALMVALSPRHSAVRRLSAAAIAAMMLATIIFTKSRAGVLGLGIMLLAFMVLGRKFRPTFTVGALAAVLLVTPFMPASFWTRMSTILDEQQDKTQFTGSAEARRVLLQEGFNTFLEVPLTGVGAGQFKNYNPNGRRERWRETHNSILQVAAETGIFGLAAFVVLIACGAIAAKRARGMLARPRRRHAPDPLRLTMSDGDRQWLRAYAEAMTAGLIGWFVCAMFASVAYSWTFYYLLALIVANRDIVAARLAAARAVQAGAVSSGAQPPERFSPEKEKSPSWTPQIA